MTRALDDPDIRAALAFDIARQLSATAVSIDAWRLLAGGAIQENWRLDATIEGGARAGKCSLVLRTDAAARVPLSLDRETEAKVLRAAHAAGVLVAEPLAVDGRDSPLGKPYVLQRWIEGSAQARRITRDPALATYGESLARALAAELARIHAITPGGADLSCLPVPMQAPARAAVASFRGLLATAGEPRPALEFVLAWLDANAPPARQLALVHSDFRTGNYMVDGGRLTGILDWEFAHWGDPDEDIGWIAARCWRFGNDRLAAGGIAPLEVFLDAYAAAAGRAVGADAVRYWQIMAAARWAVIAVLQGDRYRIGGEERLELALTGLMPAEMELDALSDVLAWRGAEGAGGPRWP